MKGWGDLEGESFCEALCKTDSDCPKGESCVKGRGPATNKAICVKKEVEIGGMTMAPPPVKGTWST